MRKPFEDCYWYINRPRGGIGCGALVEFQCKTCGKCSFYETESDYIARRDKFYKEHANGGASK